MLPIDKWFSPSEKGRNTASLAFKSRLTVSVGIHVTLLAGVSRRNASEQCHVYSNAKNETRFERE